MDDTTRRDTVARALDLEMILSSLDERLASLPDDLARARMLAQANDRIAELEEQIHLGRARLAQTLATYPSITLGAMRSAALRRRTLMERRFGTIADAAFDDRLKGSAANAARRSRRVLGDRADLD